MDKRPILIVDDSPSFLTLVRLALEREGYRVIEAGNGIEALRHLDAAPLLCIISDINMPQMDGVALVKHVKAHQLQRLVPILMFSTEANIAKMNRCREAGVRAWLSKPFNPETLVSAIRKLTHVPASGA